MEQARRAVSAAVPQGSLIMTSTNLGRPADNLRRHYSGVEAFDAEELPLLGVNAEKAAFRLVLAGRRVFSLVDVRERAGLMRVARAGELHERVRATGRRLLVRAARPTESCSTSS